ncbi:sugar-specific transcriptional regulator TrmB [Methanomicrobiaceae archaeon CYW5]|uniref:helix-turn-helix domain-containing protein n=1 Tax=Methanovulcanius yangii TaxID=1789227 RepID=UPI0029CA82DB|nr:helix-turn-helix domain-containing protein [Methanovulcanius yangii]MBT8507321.1 sugar-specific transcriptional regulator TrmB [Methanovulcanius yangii]
MAGVLEKRRELLSIMRDLTLEHGYFTVNDIAEALEIPRSTVQDWVSRLINEQCVVVKEEKKGRFPAKYQILSAKLAPACRRIFTTVDGDRVAIFHQCMSTGCAAFCAYHHTCAGGAIETIGLEGRLLVEYARIGDSDAEIGLYPLPAVGVLGVRRENGFIIQRISSVGGPAYSLTDMMAMAEGVCDVRVGSTEGIVEGEVMTRALTHLIIGVDDTDSKDGGATFALALGLIQYLGKMRRVYPIGHKVAMLVPNPEICTTGNSCSFIEVAVRPEDVDRVIERALRFVRNQSLSREWGIAVKKGFSIPGQLRGFGLLARRELVTREEALDVAGECSILLAGGNGIIGALAAVGLSGEKMSVLLNPAEMPDSTL